MQDLNIEDRQQLKKILNKAFNLNELYDLCFDLGIDHENLSTDKTGLCRDIITFHERRKNLGCLLIEIIRKRPKILETQDLFKKHPTCDPKTKIIVTLPKSEPHKIPIIKLSLAQILEINQEEITVLITLQGSWNLLISIPKKNWDRAYPHKNAIIQEIQKESIPIQSITPYDQITKPQQEKYRTKYFQTILNPTLELLKKQHNKPAKTSTKPN